MADGGMSSYMWDWLGDLYRQRDRVKEDEDAAVADKDKMIEELLQDNRDLEEIIKQKDEEIERLKGQVGERC